MRAAGAALLVAILALPACDRADDRNEAAQDAPRQPAALIGSWTTDTPADFSGEGLRTRMSEGQTRYAPDNRFAYSGRLTIFGPEIPPGGLSFRVTATGDWRRDANRLTEKYTQVQVQSENDDRELNRLAKQMAGEIRDQPASESEILSLNDQRLELRDATSGRTSSYTRRK